MVLNNEEISLNREKELIDNISDWLKEKEKINQLVSKTKSRSKNSKKLIMEHLGASIEDFNNWEWQLNNRFTTLKDLDFFFHFSDDNKKKLMQVAQKYRFSITPYYLSLINPTDDYDPLKKMSVVSADELIDGGEQDPMKEAQTNPRGVITRRYPDKLVLNVTNACAMHCRHCQRRRKFGVKDSDAPARDIDASIKYISEKTEIRDVLITGGDPFTLSDNKIEEIIGRIRGIPHVKIIRIGTRIPVTMPQRITPELISILRKYSPIYINTQFNHPIEITEESAYACSLLDDKGIYLGNQMVFLNGVNNNKYIVNFLNQELLYMGVRPYYIHHPQRITGTSHFYISIEEGLSIMKYLKGVGITSGLAIPEYILNAPNGLGKMRLPESIIEKTSNELITGTWEGKIIKYSLPDLFQNTPTVIDG